MVRLWANSKNAMLRTVLDAAGGVEDEFSRGWSRFPIGAYAASRRACAVTLAELFTA
jgi:hypothetical protein